MFTSKDIDQITANGLCKEKIEMQISQFKKGFPFVDLVRPARLTDGIKKFSESELKKFTSQYFNIIEGKKIIKFVPASGAASRMFKDLFSFLENTNDSKVNKQINTFINNLHEFAFYDELCDCMSNAGLYLEECLAKKDFKTIIEFLLLNKGLNYAALPKALLKFHQYHSHHRLAFEEHLVEAAEYSSSNGNAVLHFTISREHRALFEEKVKLVKDSYEAMFGIKFAISFSEQKPSTDTIAVDVNNEIFRDVDGSLLFRPGGHGALIDNLNDLDADIIFIKNIDNIVPDILKPVTVEYKKAIGSYLIELQKKIFNYLHEIDKGNISDKTLTEIIDFSNQQLHIELNEIEKLPKEKKVDILITKLNRPIRICGMVENIGEPGGGPFWTKNNKGEISLQIIESSQIDLSNNEQEKIFLSSTHFNPVDLVCGITDYKGNKFDLHQFIDSDTGFISSKSYNGNEIKAMELPGLWNGAMANWISVFVETPLITFNPVKTVNDLLRKEHQI